MRILKLFIILMPIMIFAQGQQNFPFSINLLSVVAAHRDTIMPLYRDGEFIYINAKTGIQAFTGTYKVAYPFVRNAAVVYIDGMYGIISRNGKWLKKPAPYQNFRIQDGSVAVFSSSNGYGKDEYSYDLNTLQENSGYINCAMPSIPEYFTFKGENGKWGIKHRDRSIKINAVYDTIAGIYNNNVIARKGTKYGVISLVSKEIIPFIYSDISTNANYKVTQITGFLKGTDWYYFDLALQVPKLILKSRHKCESSGFVELKNALGIYKTGNAYNILFKDGSTLPQNYDLITKNGIVSTKNGNVYIITDDKSAYLYYKN